MSHPVGRSPAWWATLAARSSKDADRDADTGRAARCALTYWRLRRTLVDAEPDVGPGAVALLLDQLDEHAAGWADWQAVTP